MDTSSSSQAHICQPLFFGRNDRYFVWFGFGFLAVLHRSVVYRGCRHMALCVFERIPSIRSRAGSGGVSSKDGRLCRCGARTDVFPKLAYRWANLPRVFSFVNRDKETGFRYTWLPPLSSRRRSSSRRCSLRWHYLFEHLCRVAPRDSPTSRWPPRVCCERTRVGPRPRSWPLLNWPIPPAGRGCREAHENGSPLR